MSTTSEDLGGQKVDNESSTETPAEEQAPKENASTAQLKTPEYEQLTNENLKNTSTSLERFYDVEVELSAELGRVLMPIGEVVKLGEGSVIDLDRPITSPVDIVAQGVRIATGEVVVIDDCFAVRIKEIDSDNHPK